MNHLRNQPWVNVAVFEDFDTAQALDRILSRNGFEGRVYLDKLLQTFLFLCPPRATFRVQVHRDDFKGAVQFMDTQPEVVPVLESAIHCPSCGSLRVQYPQMTRKFFLPTLLLHLGIIFRVIEHEAYCDHCHHTWNLPKSNSPSLAKTPKPAH
jgi:hypothetical protein